MTVRTYKKRAGRVTSTQVDALQRLWGTYGVEVNGAVLDSLALFGRAAPLALEIGFGMGEATAALATEQPETDVLAVDVHTPGLGNLLVLLDRGQLRNVRVLAGDARIVLGEMLLPESLTTVRVFFPDPWPKARHAKRRLVTAPFLDLVASRLRPGGLFHLATDVPSYAQGAQVLLDRMPTFVPEPETPWRPRTKFEMRALRDGRPVRDVAFRRLDR